VSPVLAAGAPLTVTYGAPANKLAIDEHDNTDTLSISSSSDGSVTTSIAGSTSPASSIVSDSRDHTDEAKSCEVQLPTPFYPPSLAQVDKEIEIQPRGLPADLGLPSVPQDKATNAIDPQDKCVIFVNYL
jgi:hypothetical protein